ncbi:MAG TPA: hypothetical protein VFV23_12045 [Verrucomicrobiae bacterium]|nr:hypothetical protein [Verrucomicrobiae bacterium]
MFSDIEKLIPHRAPMRFIDALVECTENAAAATTCFADKSFAVAGGKVLESALVECLAQTAAASRRHLAQANGKANEPQFGMLVAVSNFKIHSRPLMEKTLRIEIFERKRLGQMRMISGRIFCDGEMVASGDLSLYA